MPRRTWVSVRAALVAAGPFVLVAAVLPVGAYRVLEPTPPRHVVLLTGPEQVAFDTFGAVYRDALARRGIVLELRCTGGTRAFASLLQVNRIEPARSRASDSPGTSAHLGTIPVSDVARESPTQRRLARRPGRRYNGGLSSGV